MFEKAGKYYADWRDASGKRLRKSFTSKRAALQHEAEMKEQAHPKPKALGRLSHRSYARPSSGATVDTQPTKRPSASSLRLVPSRHRS